MKRPSSWKRAFGSWNGSGSGKSPPPLMQQLNRDIEISDAIVVEDDDNERNEGPNVASIAALIAAEDGDEDDDDGDVPPSSAPAFRKPPVPMSRRAMSASRATQQAPHPLESPAVGAMEWSTLVAERNSVGLEEKTSGPGAPSAFSCSDSGGEMDDDEMTNVGAASDYDEDGQSSLLEGGMISRGSGDILFKPLHVEGYSAGQQRAIEHLLYEESETDTQDQERREMDGRGKDTGRYLDSPSELMSGVDGDEDDGLMSMSEAGTTDIDTRSNRALAAAAAAVSVAATSEPDTARSVVSEAEGDKEEQGDDSGADRTLSPSPPLPLSSPTPSAVRDGRARANTPKVRESRVGSNAADDSETAAGKALSAVAAAAATVAGRVKGKTSDILASKNVEDKGQAAMTAMMERGNSIRYDGASAGTGARRHDGDPGDVSTNEVLWERIRILEQEREARGNSGSGARVAQLEKDNASLNKRLYILEADLELKTQAAADDVSMLHRRILDLRKSHSDNMAAAADEFGSLNDRLNEKNKETREMRVAHAKQLEEKNDEICVLHARLDQQQKQQREISTNSGAMLDLKSSRGVLKEDDAAVDGANPNKAAAAAEAAAAATTAALVEEEHQAELLKRDEKIAQLHSSLLVLSCNQDTIGNGSGNTDGGVAVMYGSKNDYSEATASVTSSSNNSKSPNSTSFSGALVGAGGAANTASSALPRYPFDLSPVDQTPVYDNSSSLSSRHGHFGGVPSVGVTATTATGPSTGGSSSRGGRAWGRPTGFARDRRAGIGGGEDVAGAASAAAAAASTAGDAHRGCLLVTCTGAVRKDKSKSLRRVHRSPSDIAAGVGMASAEATARLAEAQGICLNTAAGRGGHQVQQTSAFWDVLSRTLISGGGGSSGSLNDTIDNPVLADGSGVGSGGGGGIAAGSGGGGGGGVKVSSIIGGGIVRGADGSVVAAAAASIRHAGRDEANDSKAASHAGEPGATALSPAARAAGVAGDSPGVVVVGTQGSQMVGAVAAMVRAAEAAAAASAAAVAAGPRGASRGAAASRPKSWRIRKDEAATTGDSQKKDGENDVAERAAVSTVGTGGGEGNVCAVGEVEADADESDVREREEMASRAIAAAILAEEVARCAGEEARLALETAEGKVVEAEESTQRAMREAEAEVSAAEHRAMRREEAAIKAEKEAMLLQAKAREDMELAQRKVLQARMQSAEDTQQDGRESQEALSKSNATPVTPGLSGAGPKGQVQHGAEAYMTSLNTAASTASTTSTASTQLVSPPRFTAADAADDCNIGSLAPVGHGAVDGGLTPSA